MKDKKFESAVKKLFIHEGGYTTGDNQIKDFPTNMGIQQRTLDIYNLKYSEKNFPKNVKDLNARHAYEIYKKLYWDNTKIPKIQNERIRNAVFDMNVMGGAGRVIQRALNDNLGIDLVIDGIIGDKTIAAINSIDDVSQFMEVLKQKRIEYLKRTPNWITARNGWIKRTDSY